MTDTSKREELIEKGREAIHGAIPGSGQYEQWKSAQGEGFDFLGDLARAAFAVFEQSHTPTSDEREAIIDALLDELGWEWDEVPEEHIPSSREILGDMADRVLAVVAGFRRTVQGEPTDDEVLAALNAHYRVRLAQSEAMPGDPEVEGDAHSLEEYSSKSIDRMRAALRAALKEGENRG